MSITIPVSAQFDAADVKKQIQIINDQIRILGNTVAMAQNKKFEPVTLKSKEDLDAFIKQAQKLLKIQTELNQKLGQSGQGGKNPFVADWSKMYGDKSTRIQKMMAALQFMGVEFDDHPAPKPRPPAPPGPPRPPAPPGQPPHPGGGGWGRGWGQQGLNVLNSGLNAVGPVGGVFSNALSSGLSGGAGAGLMGLVGGLAAMGVGKIIGAIAEKIDKAQDTAIGMDKIYRQIGGIASYSKVKNTVYGAANTLGMDVGEGVGLASAYSRAANLRRGDNLGTGMLVSGGLARSYGMDPNSAASILGGFRGTNVAKNDKDVRHIATVLAETVAKSGAFANAEELLQAAGQYSATQARQSLNKTDMGRYGAGISSLVGSNQTGLDVAGSAALLSRVNAALSAGGAHGEASQMLTARVGQRMGVSPYQLRMLRENGMFATNSSTFGKDSIYGKTIGGGPEGDQSLYSATRDQMRQDYRSRNKMEYFTAVANHMGISVSQAMALENMDTGTVNGAGNRLARLGLDMGKVNATSYGTLGRIESGKGLNELTQDYLRMGGKKALSKEEREKLLGASAGTDPEALKDALMEIAAKRGAVETEGSQIRDGIAQMNNTMTRLADNAIPALNVMRMAMVNQFGGTEADLKKKYIDNETKERRKAVFERYSGEAKELQTARSNLRKAGIGHNTPEGDAAWNRLHKQQAAHEARVKGALAQIDKEVQLETNGVSSAPEVSGGTNVPIVSPAAAAAEKAGVIPSGGEMPDPVGGGGTPDTGPGGSLPAESGASGNVRGFNLGNLRASGGGWRRFTNARSGLSAMAGQLLRYRSGAFRTDKRHKTLRDLINIYAPSSENDTSTYVSQVAKWTGLNPDAEIDLRDQGVMRKVLQAMVRKENGDKGLAAAQGHYDEAIGDAMRKQSNFTANYPSEVNLNMKLDTPQGNYSAQHTIKPKPYKVDDSFATRHMQ
ncbi:lytic transglycosylase [Salmonella enterica]|nr:lytic transglycosylase [Salmonella enterica]